MIAALAVLALGFTLAFLSARSLGYFRPPWRPRPRYRRTPSVETG